MSDEISLEYQFTCTAAPVQAEGMVAGKPFYFRARGSEWAFEIEDDSREKGWHRSGAVPGEFAASWMRLDRAREIIRECALAYIDERASRPR